MHCNMRPCLSTFSFTRSLMAWQLSMGQGFATTIIRISTIICTSNPIWMLYQIQGMACNFRRSLARRIGSCTLALAKETPLTAAVSRRMQSVSSLDLHSFIFKCYHVQSYPDSGTLIWQQERPLFKEEVPCNRVQYLRCTAVIFRSSSTIMDLVSGTPDYFGQCEEENVVENQVVAV